MKRILIINSFFLLLMMATLSSCKKEIGDLNNPTIEDFLKNASQAQLNNLVAGTESGMRNNLGMYLDVVGAIGREMYRLCLRRYPVRAHCEPKIPTRSLRRET